MIYLTGAWRKTQIPAMASLGIGVMLQPGNGLRPHDSLPGWAADNGCFAKGREFDESRWLRWLDTVPRERCLFAVAPDVLADAQATLERSLPLLPRLRGMGFRAAFVLQDGVHDGLVPWAACDWLFIGGTTAFKLGAVPRGFIGRGKPVHMGRVNSERRLRYATLIGCDSADGTFLRFRNRGADGIADMRRWFQQGILPMGAGPYPCFRCGAPTYRPSGFCADCAKNSGSVKP